jgi:hypothetical protein
VKVNDGKEKVEPVWLDENRKRLEAAARVLAQIETAKAKRSELEAMIVSIDEELITLAGRYEQIRGELDEALTLTGIRRPKKPKTVKPRDPDAPRRKRGPSFIDRALELLYRDGGSYSLDAFVEDFGGTKGAGYQALWKCQREDHLVERNEKGEWQLTEDGKAEMKRRAMTGEEA